VRRKAREQRGRGAEGNESPRQLLPPTPLLLRSPAPLLLCSPAAALLALVVSQPAPVVPTFVDRARDAGINTLVVSGDPKEKRYLIESVGGGLAVIDYDNDGWMDLYVVNGATIERRESPTDIGERALWPLISTMTGFRISTSSITGPTSYT